MVIESKSLYNRFVYFAFFVVKKDWEEGRKDRRGSATERRGQNSEERRMEAQGRSADVRTGSEREERMVDI